MRKEIVITLFLWLVFTLALAYILTMTDTPDWFVTMTGAPDWFVNLFIR